MHFLTHLQLYLAGGSIDSEYNKKTANLVAAEFDKDQYPIATVKGMSSYSAGLVTYKRTLKRALTSDDSAPRRVKRSRQQCVGPYVLACLLCHVMLFFCCSCGRKGAKC